MDNTEYVVLTDEEGNDVECELLDTVAYGGANYAILLPVDSDSAEPEAIVLRETPSGDLEGFDDGAILDAVFGIFLEKNNIK